MPTEVAPRVDIVEWHRMLRDLYLADRLVGSVAILELLRDALADAEKLRASASWDQVVTRGLHTWDRDLIAERMRLDRVAYYIEQARPIPDPHLRDVYLDLRVGGPLLRGTYPSDWFDGLDATAQANVRGRSDGNWYMLGGEASAVATLWNSASALGLLTGNRSVEWLGAGINAIAVQLETSAPGEDPTAADAVVEQLAKASDAVASVWEAAQGKLIIVGSIVIAGLLFALWVWRTR